MKKADYFKMLEEMPMEQLPSGEYINKKRKGAVYERVSNVLQFFTPEMDRDMLAYGMAKSRCVSGNHEEINRIKFNILNEWDELLINANKFGNFVHKMAQDQFKTGYVSDPTWQKVFSKVQADMSYGTQILTEQILYDDEHVVAGRCDRMVIRSLLTDNVVVDIFDVKTNQDRESRKGIRYTSKKYMLAPIAYLQECEYIRDCLQLSLYGYLAEKTFGFKVGRLAIEHIQNKINPAEYIPVPYMRMEVEMMLKSFRNRNIVISEDDLNW